MTLPKNPMAVFFIILAEINLMLFTIVYTAGLSSFHPGKVVPLIFLWFVIIVILGMKFEPTLKSFIGIVIPFLGLMASLVAGVIYMDAYRLSHGKVVKDAGVAAALEYPDAVLIFFRDGRLVKECIGEIAEWDSESHSTYYSVPYVPDGWTKKDPVTVWVTCIDDTAGCLNSTGIAMIAKRYTAGVDEAEEKCGLRSHPDALRIQWIDSPEEEIKWGEKYLKIIVAAANALWVIVFLIQFVRIRQES